MSATKNASVNVRNTERYQKQAEQYWKLLEFQKAAIDMFIGKYY